MSLEELDEAVAVLAVMMTRLAGTLDGAAGLPAANLYHAIGDLNAEADALIRAGALGGPLLAAFDLSVAAGAAVSDMEAVRFAMLAVTPVFNAASAIANAGIRMALDAEVQILAATTFASRQDADAALSAINTAFDSAEEYAADNRDPSAFQALIGAHAAVVRDLTSRARPLPKVVTYRTDRPVTSHALAYRFYGDASRCDELRAENRVSQPAFMPITGSALSE